MKGKLHFPQQEALQDEFTQEEQVRQLLSEPQIDTADRDHEVWTQGNAGIR